MVEFKILIITSKFWWLLFQGQVDIYIYITTMTCRVVLPTGSRNILFGWCLRISSSHPPYDLSCYFITIAQIYRLLSGKETSRSSKSKDSTASACDGSSPCCDRKWFSWPADFADHCGTFCRQLSIIVRQLLGAIFLRSFSVIAS